MILSQHGRRSVLISTSIVPLIIIVSACSEPPSRQQTSFETVCPEGDLLACVQGEALPAFDQWIAKAISLPGSSFSLWIAGGNRQKIRKIFATCVPHRFGAGVQAAKAAFIRTTRSHLEAAKDDNALPQETCQSSQRNGHETVKLLVSTRFHFDTSRITNTPLDIVAMNAPLQFAVVCDRSSSTVDVACTPNHLLRAYRKWIEVFRITGSGFRVYQISNSRETTSRIWDVTIISGSPGEKIAYLLAAEKELEDLLKNTRFTNASAIAEGIDYAASDSLQYPGTHQLLILSDLRQLSGVNFEIPNRIPNPEEFISWLNRQVLLLNLAKFSITACGVHENRGANSSPFPAAAAQRLRDCWEQAFQQRGGKNVRIFSTCDPVF
jgi:hypothetical protein